MENKDSSRPKRGPMGGGPGRMGAPVEKAKDFKGTLKKLLKYLGKYKIAIIIVIIFAILSTVFSIVGPKILGEATTILFEGLMNMISENGLGIDFDGIKKILLTLLGLYIISAVFSYAQGWIMTKVTMKVTYKLRKDISHKINKLPLSYFDKKTQGEVLSYITNDVDTVSQTLNQGITQIITSVTMLLGILIMMLTISWQMTIVAVLVLPVAIGLVAGVVKKSQKYYIKQQEYLGNVNGHIEEMYTNHTIVRAFNGQKSETEKFEHYNQNLYNAGWKSQFLSGLMPPIMNFVSNLGYVAVYTIYEKLYTTNWPNGEYFKCTTINNGRSRKSI